MTPPRMTTLTQGFLDPKVRDWLYTIALAVGPLLIGREAMERDEWELWLAVIGSILVPGVARMNIDYSLGGRTKGKRELGREEERIADLLQPPFPAGGKVTMSPPRASLTSIDPLTYVLGRLEKLDKGQRAIEERLSDLNHWSQADLLDRVQQGLDKTVSDLAAEGEPTVVYDAVRRGQELQVDRLADDPREDPTVPPEHRP
jgi:hypothetical protein